MNFEIVGCEVKSKWHEIGGGLGVAESDLKSNKAEEAGKDDSDQSCMRRVFSKWKSARTPSYNMAESGQCTGVT